MRSLWGRLLVALTVLLAGAPALAGWQEAKSKHFIIYADLKPDELRSYAERLERFDQAVRTVRGMNDPALTDSQRLTVYALRSEGAVARLAGMSEVRGFYSARASGSVAFVPRRAGSGSDWDLGTDAIFFHEYAHHLQLQSSSFALPAWMVEGFAEFFATALIDKDGSVVIGSPPQYRAYGLFNDHSLKLEQIVGATYGELDDGQRDLLYGMGWLLTHYLSFEPSRKGQLTRYFDDIQKGMSAPEAAKAAFGDLRALDRELEKYKKGKLQGIRVAANALTVGPITVRPLGAGEAAIMEVHIRSQAGVNDKTARDVAADARKVAARFPGDPFVEVALAEAEFDAGNFAGAEAAADRALATNPNYVQALIYKGRTRMKVAEAKPDKANWREIRDWFLKANRLDTENAEPLMLYFQAFAASGAPPTKNAVEGLLYAVALVPQDSDLRVNAVHELLVEKRLEEAKRLFAPLAFQPHAPEKYRESNAKIMTAITAGDGKTALTVLEAAMKLSKDESEKR
jgi:tetratricopeptide (TPR) repeat protein